jgi:hypothetical protein
LIAQVVAQVEIIDGRLKVFFLVDSGAVYKLSYYASQLQNAIAEAHEIFVSNHGGVVQVEAGEDGLSGRVSFKPRYQAREERIKESNKLVTL